MALLFYDRISKRRLKAKSNPRCEEPSAVNLYETDIWIW